MFPRKQVQQLVMSLLKDLRPGKTAALKRTAAKGRRYANIFHGPGMESHGEKCMRAGFSKRTSMVDQALLTPSSTCTRRFFRVRP
jgi:hypothetical protein